MERLLAQARLAGEALRKPLQESGIEPPLQELPQRLVALSAMYLLPPSSATPFQLHFNYFRHTPKELGPKLP